MVKNARSHAKYRIVQAKCSKPPIPQFYLSSSRNVKFSTENHIACNNPETLPCTHHHPQNLFIHILQNVQTVCKAHTTSYLIGTMLHFLG